jgi:hypothetical protein
LFLKILRTCVPGISCLTVWICQIKFYALILFYLGVPLYLWFGYM